MSISILASEHGNTPFFVLIPLAFLGFFLWYFPLLGLIRSIDTDHRSILKIGGNALAVVVLGGVWVGSTLSMGAISQERFEVRENVAITAEEELGISDMLPVGEPAKACFPGSEQDRAEYTWVGQDRSQDRGAARGFVTKTAEVDGKCIYTFQAWA